MRNIKFRGKRVCDGLWLYGNLIQSNVGNVTINGTNKYCRVDPKTVGQFTGLHDKNGKEIYENDMVEWEEPLFDDNNIKCGGFVKWNEDNSSFCVKHFGKYNQLTKDFAQRISVEGNPYEGLKE